MKRSNESIGYVRKSKKSRQSIVRDMKASDDNGVDESDNNISDSANKTPRKWLMDEDDRLSVAVKTFGEYLYHTHNLFSCVCVLIVILVIL